jgi:hypothetical protein
MVPGVERGDGAVEAQPMPEDRRSIVFVDLSDMLVNLNACGHRLRDLKIAAALHPG